MKMDGIEKMKIYWEKTKKNMREEKEEKSQRFRKKADLSGGIEKGKMGPSKLRFSFCKRKVCVHNWIDTQLQQKLW